MKNLSIILAFVFFTFIGNKTFAQESVSKDVLLNTINNVNDLKLSNYKTSELYEYNEVYVDKIYDIIDSDKSEKEKISSLKVLKNDTDKDLKDLLDNDYKKYEKLMKKGLKPLKKKMKLLKYI